MIKLNVKDEVSQLHTVVVGIGKSSGNRPTLDEAYDAKSYRSIIKGIYPEDYELEREVDYLAKVLSDEGVEVLRPAFIDNYNQIFSRDVAFTIDDKLIKANIIPEREKEIEAYDYIFSQIDSGNIITPPAYVHIEGGDVILDNDTIYLGIYIGADYSTYKMARTNKYAIGFLKELFPDKDIVPLQLIKHDTDPYMGILHLDCCFQPVGDGKALLYPNAFMNKKDYEYIIERFGANNVMCMTNKEMFDMNTNVFSISKNKVIIDETFTRLDETMKNWGIETIKIPYRKVSLLGGLLRCTTMPLRRD